MKMLSEIMSDIQDTIEQGLFSATAVDLETIPNDAAMDLCHVIHVDGRLKDPEKIRAAQIEKMALNPFTARICCICFRGGHTQDLVVTEASDQEENRIVIEALRIISNCSRIVTYNGLDFDMPMLFMRAMLLNKDWPGVGINLAQYSRRYSRDPHLDIAKELVQWDKKIMSLESASRAILGKTKTEIDFEEFPDMIRDHDTSRMVEYCGKDAELTYELYTRASAYLF